MTFLKEALWLMELFFNTGCKVIIINDLIEIKLQMYDWIKTLRNKNERHRYFADQIEEKILFYIFWLPVQNPTTTSWNHGNFCKNIFAHGMHLLLFQYIFVIFLMSSSSSVLSVRFLWETSPSHERHPEPVHHHLNGNEDKQSSIFN